MSYVSLTNGLDILFSNVIFGKAEFSYFNQIQLINLFSFLASAFCILSKKSLSTRCHEDFFFMFSSRVLYIVLAFMFTSMIRLELMFVYCMREGSRFIFF